MPLRPRSIQRVVMHAILLALLAGCAAANANPSAAPQSPITIFAAASLTNAFKELGAAFTVASGIPVTFNFAGSQQLRAQLEQGADADVFASANQGEMSAVIAAGLVVGGTEKVFAHNHLVVIYPTANPGQISGLADLARPGLKLVLADKAVPVGQYGLDMLTKMSQDPAFGAGFQARVMANVVSYEQTVKAVVSKVQLGEADAGIVYATDAGPAAAGQVQALEVPDSYNQVATYPLAALARSKHGDEAARFVSYVLSDAGQGVLAKHGFAGGATR